MDPEADLPNTDDISDDDLAAASGGHQTFNTILPNPPADPGKFT